MSELVGYPSYDDDEDMAEEENMDLDDSLSALERLNKLISIDSYITFLQEMGKRHKIDSL